MHPILISVLVPVVAGTALLVGRSRLSKAAADIRGIALQTVIIIVVLLAIAGAVAGVLLTRGDQAVTQLENTDVRVNASNFTSKALCEAANFTWSAGTCTT